MAEHPLFTGTGLNTLFRATFTLPPLPPNDCFRTPEELREWVQKAVIDVASRQTALFAYTAGPASSATPDDRDKPRILFDEQGRFLGIALWVPEVQNWSLAGAPGELKQVVRSESTVAEDMEAKALSGWVLCDGATGGAPDLTPKEVTDDGGKKHTANPTAFFAGTAPDWDRYTVIKLA